MVKSVVKYDAIVIPFLQINLGKLKMCMYYGTLQMLIIHFQK